MYKRALVGFYEIEGKGGTKDSQGCGILIKKSIFTKDFLTHNLNLIESRWWGGERLYIHESKRDWSFLIHVVLQFQLADSQTKPSEGRWLRPATLGTSQLQRSRAGTARACIRPVNKSQRNRLSARIFN